MKLVKLSKNNVSEWNKFCFENTWFWHTTHWAGYVMNSNFDTEYINHSFFIEENGEITGIIPLIQENEQLSFQGAAAPQYICKPKHEKYVLEEIHRIAATNNIKRIHIQGPVRGYIPLAKWTCILNLDNVKPTKGHRSAIKLGEKHLKYEIVSKTGQFMQDYFKVAGKITRPQKTFETLEGWIDLGYGVLLKAIHEGETAGYIYILHYGDYSYYFMGCTIIDYKCYNVNHFLIWNAIDILKNKGIKYLEMGEIVTNSLCYIPSEKETNISRFKKGFGGEIVINPISEYFFCKKTFEETMKKRIDKYIESEY